MRRAIDGWPWPACASAWFIECLCLRLPCEWIRSRLWRAQWTTRRSASSCTTRSRDRTTRAARWVGFKRRLLAIHAADDEIHRGELRVLVADLLVSGERLIELTLVTQRIRGRELLLNVLGQRAGNRPQVTREDEVHRHSARDANRPLGFLLRIARRFDDERPRTGPQSDHRPPSLVVGGRRDLRGVRVLVHRFDGGALHRL